MSDERKELASRLVVSRKSDGRCVYSEQAKAELVAACGRPGASVSRLARECGINANQLSRWLREHRQGGRHRPTAAQQDVAQVSFVAVPLELPRPMPAVAAVSVQARLPNGVVVDLQGCDLQQAGVLIDALGKLRCSVSTKA